MKLINEAEVLSKWRPIVTEATDLDLDEDKQKVDWISEYCHYHEMNQSVNEDAATLSNTVGMGNVTLPSKSSPSDTQSSTDGSGDRPEDTLAMAMQVAAQTIGFDLVPVVAMDSAITILTYADAVYAGGEVDSSDYPTIVSLDLDFESGGNGVTEGDNVVAYDGGTGEGTDNQLATFQYLGTSHINNEAILRVVSIDDDNTGITSLADIADDVYFYNGASTDQIVQRSGEAFELVSALENHVTGFSGDDWVDDGNAAYSRGDGESAQNRTMGLKLFSKTVEAETFQVDAQLTWEQVQDIPRDHGWDPVGQMESVLLNELSQSINKYIIARLFDLGLEHVANESTGLDTFAFDSATDVSRKFDEKRRLYARMLAVSNYIANKGRRGPATFAVTNARLGSIIQDSKGFDAVPMANNVNQDSGSLYPLGTISNLTVYGDPDMSETDDRVLVGRKGDGNTPGAVFMPYMMADSVNIIAEGTMAPKIAVKSRFALVDAGFHPEAMYYVIDVSNAAEYV